MDIPLNVEFFFFFEKVQRIKKDSRPNLLPLFSWKRGIHTYRSLRDATYLGIYYITKGSKHYEKEKEQMDKAKKKSKKEWNISTRYHKGLIFPQSDIYY